MSVSDALPSVTVIIPTRPGQSTILAVDGAKKLDYPPDRLEILVARGRQPAVQRNEALRAARGELIYFLDDDAVARPDNLRRAIVHFQNPNVKLVGGPNLCPSGAPALERVFAIVLASRLAFGPSCARYDALGSVRPSGEKELILCNMMARRDAVLELGGFDESLYPNEENALMDELQKRGAQLIYDPEFFVHRRPRPTFKAFCRMLMTYGRGRAEQFRLHPTPGSALNLVPPFLCVYLVAALVACWWTGPIAFAPLALYLLAVLAQTAWSATRHGLVRSLAAAPLVILTHLLYGFGFWRGLFTKVGTRQRQPPTTVNLERF